jgi:hypothetical protein
MTSDGAEPKKNGKGQIITQIAGKIEEKELGFQWDRPSNKYPLPWSSCKILSGTHTVEPPTHAALPK